MRKVRKRRADPRASASGAAGLDFSLTATGMATRKGVRTIKPEGLSGPARLINIRDQVMEELVEVNPKLVLIEDYAHAAKFQAHQLGELGGVMNVALWNAGIPYVRVNLSAIKIYATGTGKGKKFLIGQNLARRTDIIAEDDNQVDAWWCYALCSHHLGEPLLTLPKTHLRALEKIPQPVARPRRSLGA